MTSAAFVEKGPVEKAVAVAGGRLRPLQKAKFPNHLSQGSRGVQLKGTQAQGAHIPILRPRLAFGILCAFLFGA